MKTTISLALALVALSAAAGAARGQEFRTDRTADAPAGARLQLDSQFGNITVRGWDRATVRVQARHTADVEVEIDVRGPLVQVGADRPGKTVEYVVTVPATVVRSVPLA